MSSVGISINIALVLCVLLGVALVLQGRLLIARLDRLKRAITESLMATSELTNQMETSRTLAIEIINEADALKHRLARKLAMADNSVLDGRDASVAATGDPHRPEETPRQDRLLPDEKDLVHDFNELLVDRGLLEAFVERWRPQVLGFQPDHVTKQDLETASSWIIYLAAERKFVSVPSRQILANDVGRSEANEGDGFKEIFGDLFVARPSGNENDGYELVKAADFEKVEDDLKIKSPGIIRGPFSWLKK